MTETILAFVGLAGLEVVLLLVWMGKLNWFIDMLFDVQRDWMIGMCWWFLGIDVLLASAPLALLPGFPRGTLGEIIVTAPGGALFVLGSAVGMATRPRWALPAWYRKRLRGGRYRPASPPTERPSTLWGRARADHMYGLLVIPLLPIAGLLIARMYCVGVDSQTCDDTIRTITIAGLASGTLFALVADRAGWLTPRIGAEGARLRSRSMALGAWGWVIGLVIYLGFRFVSLPLRYATGLALLALFTFLTPSLLGVGVEWLRRELRPGRPT